MFQQSITSRNLESQLEKGETHVEYIDVTRNGKTFKRRQKIANDKEESEKGPKSLSSDMKNNILYAHSYKGELYNNEGERLNIPSYLKKEVIEFKNRPSLFTTNKSNPQDHKKTLQETHKHFTETVLPLIEKKDELLKKEIDKQQKSHQSLYSLENKRGAINRATDKIHKGSSYKELYDVADIINTRLNIVPDISVTRNDKTTVLKSDAFQKYLQAEIDKRNQSGDKSQIHKPANVDKIEVLGLEDMEEDDFLKFKFNPDHDKAYKKINQHLNKVSKKDELDKDE